MNNKLLSIVLAAGLLCAQPAYTDALSRQVKKASRAQRIPMNQ